MSNKIPRLEVAEHEDGSLVVMHPETCSERCHHAIHHDPGASLVHEVYLVKRRPLACIPLDELDREVVKDLASRDLTLKSYSQIAKTVLKAMDAATHEPPMEEPGLYAVVKAGDDWESARFVRDHDSWVLLIPCQMNNRWLSADDIFDWADILALDPDPEVVRDGIGGDDDE